jgi:hypothetical protein
VAAVARAAPGDVVRTNNPIHDRPRDNLPLQSARTWLRLKIIRLLL